MWEDSAPESVATPQLLILFFIRKQHKKVMELKILTAILYGLSMNSCLQVLPSYSALTTFDELLKCVI